MRNHRRLGFAGVAGLAALAILTPVSATAATATTTTTAAAQGASVLPGELALKNYDGSVAVRANGVVDGRPGNWHVVAFGLDNDDDGFVGGIEDWTCPAGAVPPAGWPRPATPCTLDRSSEFYGYPAGEFNHRGEKVTVIGSVVEEYQVDGEWVSAPLAVSVTVQGVGDPALTYEADGRLSQERWSTVKVWGKVGGVGLLGPKRELLHGWIAAY